MGLNDKIKELLNDFNEKLVIDTRESLQTKLDERASSKGGKFKGKSRLWASVAAPPAIYNKGLIIAKLTMNGYWAAVNDGRTETKKSGDGSLRKNLEKWIQTRGIKVEISKRKEIQTKTLKNKKIRKSFKKLTREKAIERMAYGMAQNIHKNGIKPTHFFDEVLNDGRIAKLKEDLTELVKTEFTIEIRKEIKK